MGDASNIVVAQMARVYLAPVGTAAPTDPVQAMPTGWREVGLFTPDSLAWGTTPAFSEVTSHQSNYPTRRFQTSDAATVSVDLQEWNGANFKAVYGGGNLVSVAADPAATPPVAAHYRFEPPGIGGRSNIAAVLEIIDGTKHYRRIIPMCTQNEGVAQAFNKTADSTLPLRLAILGNDTALPWYDLNDDPSFAPAA